MWKEIPMYSWWYVFQIPPDSSLLVSTYIEGFNDIYVSTHPFKSIWTTENYGTSTKFDDDVYYDGMNYHIHNGIIANFTVLVFNLPKYITLALNNGTYNSR